MKGALSMPICENCKQKWSYIDTFKIPFTLEQKKYCPHCGVGQYVTSKTRSRTFLLTIFAVLMIIGLNIWLGPSLINILIAILIIPLYAIIYPLFVDLSSEKDR